MKILYFQWHSFMNRGIEKALKQLNVQYEILFYQFHDWEKDDDFLERFEMILKEGNYQTVFSVNFSPLISKVCENKKILYIAWVYDSPMHIRDISSLNNKYSHVFFFDRGQVEEYHRHGYKAYYMPLAVDETDFICSVSNKTKEEYTADISMVGKLYETDYDYFMGPLDDYERGYVEGLVRAQSKLYGGYLLSDLVTEEFVERLNKRYFQASKGKFQIDRRELEFMLACEVTRRERFILLNVLSKYYKVNLYSEKGNEELKRVNKKGYIDYYTQMPLAFQMSKVNLNISLKTIRTGIPLRVLDVIGCGGFVLSNFQVELAEYFDMETECIVYTDLEDMLYKTEYYLRHEDKRCEIIRRGMERVRKDFTFRDRMERMLLNNLSIK